MRRELRNGEICRIPDHGVSTPRYCRDGAGHTHGARVSLGTDRLGRADANQDCEQEYFRIHVHIIPRLISYSNNS